ncbi:hypothetical protein E3N88_38818 [Mikania micrantha]|uniref:Uncharacterized protein n=1 Tax=Mikania micrantha TaxID=192012 RepID=A0A5N6LV60_9ASTR|nr:hypothetical protein E3N88_38818 [Mikania micrantha]
MLTGGHNECNSDVDVGFSDDPLRQTETVEFCCELTNFLVDTFRMYSQVTNGAHARTHKRISRESHAFRL